MSKATSLPMPTSSPTGPTRWATPPGTPQISPSRREPSDPVGRLFPLLRRLRQRPLGLHRQLVLQHHRSATGFRTRSGQSPDGEEQLDFLERVGKEASAQGKLVFVVMHMPTRDPGDQTYRDPSATFHTMGKSVPGAADNERLRASGGRGRRPTASSSVTSRASSSIAGAGDIPYFIDGGAGVSSTPPVPSAPTMATGMDSACSQVKGASFATDAVPIFVKDGIEIAGPTTVRRGRRRHSRHSAINPSSTIRPRCRCSSCVTPIRFLARGRPQLARWLRDAGPGCSVCALALMLMISRYAAAGPRRTSPARAHSDRVRRLARLRRRLGRAAERADLDAGRGAAESRKDLDELEAPSPGASGVRHRRSAASTLASQTADGGFRGACPGRSKLTITSGFESTSKAILVPSAPGRIVRSIRGGRERVGIGRRTRVAAVALAQRARVVAVVRRNGHRVRRLESSCRGPAGSPSAGMAGSEPVARARPRSLAPTTCASRSFQTESRRKGALRSSSPGASPLHSGVAFGGSG